MRRIFFVVQRLKQCFLGRRRLILIAVFVFGGCQTQSSPQQPTLEQRKELGAKLILKALNDLHNKDLKSSIIDLEISVKVNPAQPEAYLLLGQILLKIQEYGPAAQFLDEASKVFPDNGTVFYMLSIADKMIGKKSSAILAARHSVEVFGAQQDKDNMLKASALLQELMDMPDSQSVPATKQNATND